MVEEGLEDQDCGQLVDDAFAAHLGMACVVKLSVGLSGGKPLVPQMHRQMELFDQGCGEGLGLGGLGAEVAGHVERISDDDLRDAVLADDAAERREVGAAVGARDGQQGLGSEAELVRQSDADAPIPHVEAHQPGDIEPLRLLHCIHPC